ncbi:MAG: TetR/AcrR family transcriptional regulator [Oscillospiraceae bacterium]
MAKSTKNEIVGALRELLQAKRLDDITVTELVERCGISRQAFYYHFSDLYSVVDYAIQQLLDELGVAGPEDWRSSLEQVLTLLRGNRTLVLNVYRAYERSYVEHDLRRWCAAGGGAHPAGGPAARGNGGPDQFHVGAAHPGAGQHRAQLGGAGDAVQRHRAAG